MSKMIIVVRITALFFFQKKLASLLIRVLRIY